MRVAFFGTDSEYSRVPFARLAGAFQIVALVKPDPRPVWRRFASGTARRLGILACDEIESMARRSRIPILRMASKNDDSVNEQLRRLLPDVICVAGFPWVTSDALCGIARFGGINVHPSLLPRHRGFLPWFWIYHSDDRETGVTVHRMTPVADSGPVILQNRFLLPRGYPVTTLMSRAADIAAEMLCESLSLIASGCAREVAQDEAQATNAPRVQPGTRTIDFATWPAERVWHFLKGLYPHFIEPLFDERGGVVRYRGVGSWTGETIGAAGLATRERSGWRLHCVDGSVELEG